MNNVLKHTRRIFNTSDGYILAKVSALENNEYKVTYYEIVSATSGTITPPTGATFNDDEFGESGNAILSSLAASGKPNFESPLTSGGVVVTVSLNTGTGAWVTSGSYVDAQVAIIYSIKIKAVDWSNLIYSSIVDFEESSSTGTGGLVRQTSPTLITPNIGVASGTSLNVTGLIQTTNYNSTGGVYGVVNNLNLSSKLSNGVISFYTNAFAGWNIATFRGVQTSGASPSFDFFAPANTGQTASTNIPNFKVTGSTKTWLAGAITNQYWNYFSANTAAFSSASTITNSYGLYVEAATAGTNATITNNYAAGFGGSIHLASNNSGIFANDSTSTRRKLIDFAGDNLYIEGRKGSTDIFFDPTSSSKYTVIKSGGSVGIYGVASPSANLHIGAASGVGSARAPLKFTSGITMTTPEIGAVEYDGRFFMTEGDAIRRNIVLAASTTKTTAAAPYANDGYVEVQINGTTFKLMTTA